MRFNIKVGEVMTTNVKTVSLDETVKKSAELMRNEKIGSVVVMGDKNVKGIVTTSDIVYKYVADNKGQFVKDIMTVDPVSISPNKTIEEAARLMAERRIEKLLVFNMNKLVGIITNNDIIKIEPALYEVLLEKLKMGSSPKNEDDFDYVECEVCGNYSDTVEELNGEYVCSECAGKTEEQS